MLIFISRSGNPIPIKQELGSLSINAKYRYSSFTQNMYGHYFKNETPTIREEILKIRERLVPLQIDVLSVVGLVDRNHKSLFIISLDSFLNREEVIKELASKNGAMESLDLNAGLAEVLPLIQKEKGGILILSDGFDSVIEKFAKRFSLDLFSANLQEMENRFTKDMVLGTIVNKSQKKDFVIHYREEGLIPISQTVAVGYESNDSQMIQEAGIGIGFHASPELKREILNWIDFHSILSLLFLFDLRD